MAETEIKKPTVSKTFAWFHGGKPGLNIGDYILPPSETGVKSVSDIKDQVMRQAARAVHDKTKVYLTSHLDAALFFAAFAPFGNQRIGGDVYGVEPVGEVMPDPDYLDSDGGSVCASKARIVAIIRRDVPRLF